MLINPKTITLCENDRHVIAEALAQYVIARSKEADKHAKAGRRIAQTSAENAHDRALDLITKLAG
jgi:hypothetical protein